MKRVYAALFLGFTYSLNAFGAVPTDFDNDGVSDLTRIETVSGDSLVWKTTLSSTGETITLATFGNDGDTPILASWLGQGSQIGVIAKPGAEDEELRWSILDLNGNRVDKLFGKSGDLVVAGGDFNGNGTTDAAVVRLVNGKAVWEITYDLFSSVTPETQEFSFGKKGDRVFFARVEANGPDWIGVIGKGKGNRSQARMRNLITGEVRRFNRMPKLASAGSRPRPLPIRQPSGADLLAFQVAKSSNTDIAVFDLTGARISVSSLLGTGDIGIGDLNPGPGYEIAFQGDDESVIINPVLSEEREAQIGGGTVVDEIMIGVVGSSATDSSSGSGAGSDGGSSSSGGSLSQCSSTVGWPSGHIYKTIGSEHFSDIRRNTIGIVVRSGGRGPFPSCVQALDTSGRVVAQLGLYQKGAGWAARYYAGIGCGSGTPFNGAAVASKARANTGSSKIYMNFGGVCYGPIEASVCIGSQQC